VAEAKTAPAPRGPPIDGGRRHVVPGDVLIVLGAAFATVATTFPSVGAEGWPFKPGRVHAHGELAALVHLARGRWDVGVLRLGLLVVLLVTLVLAAAAARGWRPRRFTLCALATALAAAAVLPPVLVQMALRESTAPWFYTNDSTYQIELAGGVVRDGSSPYGHDYRSSGLERFYSMHGVASRQTQSLPQLQHYPYFPGSAELSAAWTVLPRPWDDYRLLVALATVLLVPATLLFPGPTAFRLAVGVALACNPLAVRLAWFGSADAPCVLAIVAAFGFAARGRSRSAGAALAVAILLKQFALAAILPLLVMIWLDRSRREAGRAAAAGAIVLAIGLAPFLIASPRDLYRDTVVYGTSTYRIVSYGISGVLVRFHLVSRHSQGYPTVPILLLVWLPLAAGATWLQIRCRSLWAAGGSFTASVLVLLTVARVFQESYVIYPLAGVAISALLAGREISVPALTASMGHGAPAPLPSPGQRR
jgi:hypothetical protein